MTDFLYKVLLVGDAGVGKTNLLLRFVENRFIEGTGATIGVNFLIKEVNVSYEGNNYILQMNIWDIAGYTTHDLPAMKRAYYRGAQAVIFVYDITRRETLSNLQKWEEGVNEYISLSPIRFVVGNKEDLESERQISIQECQESAESLKALSYFETSAKTGKHVQEMFEEIALNLIKKALAKEKEIS